VAETTAAGSTLYLTDTSNPTWYSQPLEAKTTGSGTHLVTYLIGDRVFGQADGTTLSYLLADGHGSTRLLTSSTGAVVATFNYDAFGGAINFNPTSAPTIFLFGGDAVYDSASGLYLHGDGVRARLAFYFLQRDSYAGSTQDPLSLHKYLYAGANPVNQGDPGGYMSLPEQGAVTGISATVGAVAAEDSNAVLQIAEDVYGATIEYGVDLEMKINELETPFTQFNCRENLVRLTGFDPGSAAQAHHVFPQAFFSFFNTLGVNIHDPQYLEWWESADHLSNATAFNALWEDFISTSPSIEDVIAMGKAIMDSVNYADPFN
jgi:hypothetical protein